MKDEDLRVGMDVKTVRDIHGNIFTLPKGTVLRVKALRQSKTGNYFVGTNGGKQYDLYAMQVKPA